MDGDVPIVVITACTLRDRQTSIKGAHHSDGIYECLSKAAHRKVFLDRTRGFSTRRQGESVIRFGRAGNVSRARPELTYLRPGHYFAYPSFSTRYSLTRSPVSPLPTGACPPPNRSTQQACCGQSAVGSKRVIVHSSPSLSYAVP